MLDTITSAIIQELEDARFIARPAPHLEADERLIHVYWHNRKIVLEPCDDDWLVSLILDEIKVTISEWRQLHGFNNHPDASFEYCDPLMIPKLLEAIRLWTINPARPRLPG